MGQYATHPPTSFQEGDLFPHIPGSQAEDLRGFPRKKGWVDSYQ